MKDVSIAKLEPLVGAIVKLTFVPGDAVNSFKINPYVGAVCAVPTVLNPASVRSCQYFRTPVV